MLWFIALGVALYLPWAPLNVLGLYGVSVGIIAVVAIDAAFRAKRYRRGQYAIQKGWVLILVLLGGWALTFVVRQGMTTVWAKGYILPTGGMADTALPGDTILGDKLWYRWQPVRRGDVILFRHRQDGVFMQRVVGLAGETIDFRDRRLFIDGSRYTEPYAHWTRSDDRLPRPDLREKLANVGPVKVPDGKLYVVGDNRLGSRDSRSFGPIDRSRVIARATMVYFSERPSRSATALAREAKPWHQRYAPGQVRWARFGVRFDNRPEPAD
jgi:signal peptidase I